MYGFFLLNPTNSIFFIFTPSSPHSLLSPIHKNRLIYPPNSHHTTIITHIYMKIEKKEKNIYMYSGKEEGSRKKKVLSVVEFNSIRTNLENSLSFQVRPRLTRGARYYFFEFFYFFINLGRK